MVDRKAVMRPFMTVIVEQWAAVDGAQPATRSAMSIARSQMITDGPLVHDNVWIRDVGFVDLESVPFIDMSGIWETTARMLKGLGKRGRTWVC